MRAFRLRKLQNGGRFRCVISALVIFELLHDVTYPYLVDRSEWGLALEGEFVSCYNLLNHLGIIRSPGVYQLRFTYSFPFIICPIAIAWDRSMGRIIKSVCVCQCVCLSVCEHTHGRISWSIFNKISTDVRTNKRKNGESHWQRCESQPQATADTCVSQRWTFRTFNVIIHLTYICKPILTVILSKISFDVTCF